MKRGRSSVWRKSRLNRASSRMAGPESLRRREGEALLVAQGKVGEFSPPSHIPQGRGLGG
jgi:hypothetical protein